MLHIRQCFLLYLPFQQTIKPNEQSRSSTRAHGSGATGVIGRQAGRQANSRYDENSIPYIGGHPSISCSSMVKTTLALGGILLACHAEVSIHRQRHSTPFLCCCRTIPRLHLDLHHLLVPGNILPPATFRQQQQQHLRLHLPVHPALLPNHQPNHQRLTASSHISVLGAHTEHPTPLSIPDDSQAYSSSFYENHVGN
jgi:hypothetical protein